VGHWGAWSGLLSHGILHTKVENDVQQVKHTPNIKNKTKNEKETIVFGCGMEEDT
jgi:hypothetical protein